VFNKNFEKSLVRKTDLGINISYFNIYDDTICCRICSMPRDEGIGSNYNGAWRHKNEANIFGGYIKVFGYINKLQAIA